MRRRKQSRMTPELGTYMVPLHFWFRFGGGEKWKTGETHFSTGKRQRTASESLMGGEKDNQSHGHRSASHRGLAAAPSEAPQSFSGTALGQSIFSSIPSAPAGWRELRGSKRPKQHAIHPFQHIHQYPLRLEG